MTDADVEMNFGKKFIFSPIKNEVFNLGGWKRRRKTNLFLL